MHLLKLKSTNKFIIIITLYLTICHLMYNNINYEENVINISRKSYNPKITFKNINRNESNIKKNQNNIIGNIKIKKLNINRNIYKMESENNNVEKNITMLKESNIDDNENGIIYLAAHSGNANNSYFKNLDKLGINDIVELTINNKLNYYEITNKWEQEKNGYINITKNNYKQLILTTCSPEHKDKQLIINAKIKKS